MVGRFRKTEGVAGALSVSGLTSRMPSARVREIGPLVALTCREISRALGSSQPRAPAPGIGTSTGRNPR